MRDTRDERCMSARSVRLLIGHLIIVSLHYRLLRLHDKRASHNACNIEAVVAGIISPPAGSPRKVVGNNPRAAARQ